MSPAFVLTDRDVHRQRRRAIFATTLLCTVAMYWSHQWPKAEASDQKAAVASALFRIGDYVCRKNDGLGSIEAYPSRPTDFTFACRDGAMFRESARIAR